MSILDQKKFETMNQEIFAKASGDWNPMHMDPLTARRTQMGAPVVHGMHTALACLDAFARATKDLPILSSIMTSFLKPVYVGDSVIFSIVRQSPPRLMAEVDGVKVMTIDLTLGTESELGIEQKASVDTVPINHTSRVRNFAEIEKAIGTTEKIAITSTSEKLFPNAARLIGARRVCGLTALSTLVGMECPGLHSIFIGFTVNLVADDAKDGIDYSVLSTDDRFQRIKLSVAGAGLKGVVDAAVRTPPVLQPGLREIAAQIKPDSFSGQKVLVVGGSRGVGEYAAKAVAAGGGQVTVTYSVGVEEARALAAEIKAFGGEADLLHYDVCLPAAAQLETLKVLPTHVYYFATGRIFGRRGNEFSPVLYQQFHQFYVAGFYDLCSALHKMSEKFSVFYPSSVAVTPEDRPKGMTEYAMAKAAGELLCADMKWLLPGVEVTVKRLPRLRTDQTATLVPVPGESSMDILLPMILEMQR